MGLYENKNGVLSPIAGRGNIDGVYKAQGILGAKNLLKVNGTSATSRGITATINSDGTVTLDDAIATGGTATFSIVTTGSFADSIYANEFILSGTPSSLGSDDYCLQLRDESNNHIYYNGHIVTDTGNGVTVDFSKLTLEDSTPVDVANVRLIIRVASGVSGGNGVFKPMLRLASDTDSTYQPYAMTNQELTERIEKRILYIPKNTYQTVAEALSALYQAYSALSTAEKRNAFIGWGSGIYHNVHLNGIFVAESGFVFSPPKFTIYTLYLYNSTSGEYTVSESGLTVVETNNNAQTANIGLYVRAY